MSNSLTKIYLLIFTFLVALGCEFSSDENYSLLLEDGIYVEVYDSTFQAKGRYTKDNFIYTHGVNYQYDYYYQSQKGVKFKYIEKEKTSNMSFKEKAQSWEFVKFDSIEYATIDHYELSIDTTINHMLYKMPGYNQTVINYIYRQVNKESEVESTTGLVENRENVWLHPPRQGLFQILELNPFPFIQRPYEIGNTWNWSLRIGETWGDNRWVEWEGEINNKIKYEIINRKPIQTNIGILECFEVKGSAISSLGETFLTSYFNADFGFVKLDYTNIDSSKIIIEINQIGK